MQGQTNCTYDADQTWSGAPDFSGAHILPHKKEKTIKASWTPAYVKYFDYPFILNDVKTDLPSRGLNWLPALEQLRACSVLLTPTMELFANIAKLI